MHTKTGVATWKRPIIWALGEDKTVWQWMTVLMVVAIVACVVGNFTAHKIWLQDWAITVPWTLPTGLAKDFALLGESTISETIIDPLVLDREREESSKFWSMAARRSDHFLYIVGPVGGGVGIQFQAKNPEEVQPIAWEEHFLPFSTGGWRGKYSPTGVTVNREAWTLDIRYRFDPSPVLWMLLVAEWLLIVAPTLFVYGFVVQPLHHVFAESLAGPAE